MSILKLENVGYRYNDAPKDMYVFKNINYQFEQGKMYAIKGKSGTGKKSKSYFKKKNKCGRYIYLRI